MGIAGPLRHPVAMSLFLVAFPRLSDSNLAWIQSLRAQHDRERHALIEPHITLVFGTTALSPDDFAAHAEDCLQDQRPIPLAFRSAEAVKDPLGEDTQVYLLPAEGREALTALHDRLYSGPLASELRHDIPYRPHITVAAKRDAAACEALTDQLNARGIDIAGTVDALDLIVLEDGRIKRLGALSLFE